MTIAELNARMSWAEYQEWQVFDALEPIGFKRTDMLAAHAARWSVLPHVKEPPSFDELLLFDEARFDADEEDEAEFDLGDWLDAAERAGVKVIEEG